MVRGWSPNHEVSGKLLIPETRPRSGRAVYRRKLRVDEAHSLDLAELRRRGLFRMPPGTWWRSTREPWLGPPSVAAVRLMAEDARPVALEIAHPAPGTDSGDSDLETRDPEAAVAQLLGRRSGPAAGAQGRPWLAYRVGLTPTRPFFGGRRWWALCPACGRRARILYRPHGSRLFACRLCCRLTYTSRQAHRLRFWEGFARPARVLDEFHRARRTRRPSKRLLRAFLRLEAARPAMETFDARLAARVARAAAK